MAVALTVPALRDETVDALVWRALRLGASAVEAVLRANPALAELGPFLPLGHPVLIPAEAHAPVARPLVQLWT